MRGSYSRDVDIFYVGGTLGYAHSTCPSDCAAPAWRVFRAHGDTVLGAKPTAAGRSVPVAFSSCVSRRSPIFGCRLRRAVRLRRTSALRDSCMGHLRNCMVVFF